MTTAKVLLKLATLALGLAMCLPVLAETAEQVQQRLDRLRQLDAEAATRRQETVELQERRRREEYARRWRCYGNEEVDVLIWRQQRDGTWVTVSKPASGFIDCPGSDKSLAQPNRPDPRALASRPPARFDASLDELVRDGLVSPEERARIRSGSGTTPFNVPAHEQACNSGALNQQECSSGLVVRWRGRTNQGSGADGSSGLANSLVGVSCTTLMVNRKPPYKPWGSWQRPGRGTTDEQLVIDRCAAPNHLSMP